MCISVLARRLVIKTKKNYALNLISIIIMEILNFIQKVIYSVLITLKTFLCNMLSSYYLKVFLIFNFLKEFLKFCNLHSTHTYDSNENDEKQMQHNILFIQNVCFLHIFKVHITFRLFTLVCSKIDLFYGTQNI